ncbi:MAG: hypothetical protein HPY85_17160 [Anaerolineae bacterium]|nr:hypothetical protein [Anaerolineae bacterium]
MRKKLIHFEPRSVSFQTDSVYSRYQDRAFYAHMFLEDFGTSIMPIGGRRYSGKPFSVSVLPDEKQHRIKVNLLFPSEYHSYDKLYSPMEETVSGFIEHCAKRLIVRGTQYYEIVPASVNPEMVKGTPNFTEPVFVLVNISGRVKKLGGVYIQFIPKNLWNKVHKKFVLLPASSVWQVSIPKEIVGTRSIEKVLKGLFVAGGKHQVEMKLIDEGILKKGTFDVDAYNRNVELYVAWLTRYWGWDVRSSLQRYTLEYYQIYRRIVSAYSLAIFREYIFQNMNSLLRKIGYGCQMDMDGLPTSFSISQMFTKLEEKGISFKEAYDLTNIH